MDTTVIDVHVENLRKLGYNNFEEWVNDKNNVYIGRFVFYVKGTYESKWANKYTIKKYGLEQVLKLYENDIIKSDIIKDIEELRGKNLGCWCVKHSINYIRDNKVCHGEILLKLLHEKN